jgi:GxxExxY protein
VIQRTEIPELLLYSARMKYSSLPDAERVRINRISNQTIGAAIKVHSVLGPGLLESAYEVCLAAELRKRGHQVLTQIGLPVVYEGVKVNLGFRLDLLVDGCVVLELKASEGIARVHRTQLLSYLRLSGHHLGLLINFHVDQLKEGLVRVVNEF